MNKEKSKNFAVLVILALIISCIFVFQIEIHFSVFENITTISINLLILSVFSIVLSVIFVILIIIYKKNKKVKNEG